MKRPRPLKAPFPAAGGKSAVADLVWQRFGNVDNYVEPFVLSGAVLLRRPADHFEGGYRTETINDVNHFVVNFHRAVRDNPALVAKYADSPVTEADLHARHRWLVTGEHVGKWRKKIETKPDYSDAKIAGWWVWGMCCWIGPRWCLDEPAVATAKTKARPILRPSGNGGVTRVMKKQMPSLSPGTGGLGKGVHRSAAKGRPQLADAFDIGRGVNAGGNVSQKKRTRLGGRKEGGTAATGVHSRPAMGQCKARREWLTEWMEALSDRLRLVRVLYGHWRRTCQSKSVLTRLGITGVFLDPPYPSEHGVTGEASRDANLYVGDKAQDLNKLRNEVLGWCRRWGPDPMMRIAVCGYEGDGYEELVTRGWEETAWETGGGYSNQRRAGKAKSANAKRERIWWSPACAKPVETPSLFGA